METPTVICDYCGLEGNEVCKDMEQSYDCMEAYAEALEFNEMVQKQEEIQKANMGTLLNFPNPDEVKEAEPITEEMIQEALIPLQVEVNDAVYEPNHYARWNIEPITFILQNGLGFGEGNVVKYILRHEFKNGPEDVRKAMRYCELILREQYGLDANGDPIKGEG